MKSRLFTSIATRAAVAIMFAMVGLGTTARANVMPTSWQTSNRGTLKISSRTQVGSAVLEPGAYEVKVRNTEAGAVVEFARWTYNPYAAEGLPVYDREVVATVPALRQTAKSASASTGLLLTSGKAIGLQIRGDSVEYLF